MSRTASIFAGILLGGAWGGAPALAQAPADAVVAPPTAPDATAPGIEEAENAWEFSAAAFAYVVPDDRDYVSATVTADRGWLHLEGRYNYEDLDTGSVFAGINFSFGETVKLEATPIVGAVFGDTDGIAPGYEITLTYRQLVLYSEGEYLFDLNDSSGDFFYSWSELSYYLNERLRFGLVGQRTHAYETDLDYQPGLLLGISFEPVEFTAYVLGWDNPTFVFSVGVAF